MTDCFDVFQLLYSQTREIQEAGIEIRLTHTPTEDSTAQLLGN